LTALPSGTATDICHFNPFPGEIFGAFNEADCPQPRTVWQMKNIVGSGMYVIKNSDEAIQCVIAALLQSKNSRFFEPRVFTLV
jgi:hypothetical protein